MTKWKSKDDLNYKRGSHVRHANMEALDDEIDTFHKKRDVIPLNMSDDDDANSSWDDELPIFDNKDINCGDFDNSDNEDNDEDNGDYDDDDEGDAHVQRFVKKIQRQQKFLREKFGGVDDEISLDEEEDDPPTRAIWGGEKSQYYGGDNYDFELQSSDDEDLKGEEEEALRLQRERARFLSAADFGLEDDPVNENCRELSLHEISDKGKDLVKASFGKGHVDGTIMTSEEVPKELEHLSKKEQLEIVDRVAPELIGLISELNDSLDQLEFTVNPLVSKMKVPGIIDIGGAQYLEVKKIILLAFCQAITFYLLLKSEGLPVRDHPVIGRLVEIKKLLEKMKNIEGNLPLPLAEILNNEVENLVVSDSKLLHETELNPINSQDDPQPGVTNGMAKEESLIDSEVKVKQKLHHKENVISVESRKMLEMRAALKKKLKHHDLCSSLVAKHGKSHARVIEPNRKLVSRDDFDDETVDVERSKCNNNRQSSMDLSESPQHGTIQPNSSMVTFVDDGNLLNSGGLGEVEVDMSTLAMPSLPEVVDGKRKISSQMAKNKGLTRPRKKLIKNPRKKYRLQHGKSVMRRKGQVRDVRKLIGSYGGEATGINANVSRSVRF